MLRTFMTDQPRAALERLIKERGEDYAALSRLIGRNPAYIQQFIKRGSPKRLSEGDRSVLARYFGVGEELLGGTDRTAGADAPELCQVSRLDVGAAAGSGTLNDGERVRDRLYFEAAWLRRVSAARPEELSIIGVEGDSMVPTLIHGDEIMVNTADAANRLRDGIYVLRRDEALVVKRIGINPATRLATVRSDNPAYPLWPECRPTELTVVGRVVWVGRRLV
jgi:phage repressor protein C with HTH and peptisase S24 domain